MNDFVADVLREILKHADGSSCTRQSLVFYLQKHLDEDIEDYEVYPIIERAIQINILKQLNDDLLYLTDYGRQLLINPTTDFHGFWSIQGSRLNSEGAEHKDTPFANKHLESLDLLIKSYKEYMVNLRKYLKSLLMNMNAYSFESLVIDVLIQSKEALHGEVTKKSGDGGIDGLLYRTPLKQGEIPVQVKRYAENNLVGEDDIRDFIGAWSQKHFSGAYFVTTSSYTNKAILKGHERGITLIDGTQLVDLMIQYKVGLEVKNELTFCLTPSLEFFD
ncbi:restriction endonuclease [Bacillus sp. AG236]|nr:restriction endonuclease [Bacillus sp. AG236]